VAYTKHYPLHTKNPPSGPNAEKIRFYANAQLISKRMQLEDFANALFDAIVL
jgi:hypothetical protein